MKKTEGQKSRETVPLSLSHTFLKKPKMERYMILKTK
jgi:hypothetical protein